MLSLTTVYFVAKCLPPANVVNGGFHVYAPDNRPEYDIESKIVFHCDDGYRIYGSNIDIKCVLSSDGSAKWSKPFPVCRGMTHLFLFSILHCS